MTVYSSHGMLALARFRGRYLLFTPIGQNALRRFMRDAFAHVQQLDTSWLGSQSTGELSRVFSRAVLVRTPLLQLVVFFLLLPQPSSSFASRILTGGAGASHCSCALRPRHARAQMALGPAGAGRRGRRRG